MANPPFNVNKVDKERLKDDPRFPFGLPRVDNGARRHSCAYVLSCSVSRYLAGKKRSGVRTTLLANAWHQICILG